jgi:hypothetical protein
MGETHTQPDFTLGLTMAGAVSAGAYTAGVFDFLFQALDAWEQEKKRERSLADAEKTVPTHAVKIAVITGASAGGIVGALGAVTLAGGIRPEQVDAPEPGKQTVRYVFKELYEAWVRKPELSSPVGAECFLSNEDLEDRTEPVRSLLNSRLLRRIAVEALEKTTAAGRRYPYLTDPLHLFLTLTNLRGVPYTVRFAGTAAQGYGMADHADRAHYAVTGLGTATHVSPWLDVAGDKGTTLDLAQVVGKAPLDPDRREDFITHALATGAFPIGLAARGIDAHTCDYAGRAWPINLPLDRLPKPDWRPNRAGETDYPLPYAAVDGGVINNEPFEIARWTLREARPQPAEGETGWAATTAGLKRNERDPESADRAVIMIDPFPDPPAFDPDDLPKGTGDHRSDTVLGAIVGRLVGALKNQSRFKPQEFINALDPNVFSRFLIAPRRTKPNEPEPEPFALASALLGAFGGFADTAFREHDFKLGRRNCQHFLSQTLVIGETNDVVRHWPAQVAADTRFVHDREEIGNDGVARTVRYRRLIPLVGSAADEVPFPTWPGIDAARVRRIMEDVAARADAVVPRLISQRTAAPLLQILLRFAWSRARRAVLEFIRGTIESELVLRDQHTDWARQLSRGGKREVGHRERAVMASLLDPRWDLRTVDGICRARQLKAAEVEAFLRDRRDLVAEGPREPRTGARTYTFVGRRPSRLMAVPFVGSVVGYWQPLKID